MTEIEELGKQIEELEASYPKDYSSREWHIHHTKVRDAYWQRRMKKAKIEGLDLVEVAKVY